MGDTWTILTPNGPHELNPTFHAPKYEPGSVAGPGVLRRDDRATYQRSGDGLPTPGPLTLHGRVWRDDRDTTALVTELNAIRTAVMTCTSVTRSNNAGTYTYDQLAGGATPEITPDGLGGWLVHIELWPGRAEPTFIPSEPPLTTLMTSYSANPAVIPAGLNRQHGWRFTAKEDRLIWGLRQVTFSPGWTYEGRIWRHSDEELLSTVNEWGPFDAFGWREGALAAPLPITQGETYYLTLANLDTQVWSAMGDDADKFSYHPAIEDVTPIWMTLSGFPANVQSRQIGLVDALIVT